MEKKNIAVLYQKGDLISKGKLEILSFINSKSLLLNKGCSDLFSTEMIDIHWINVRKRNLNKLFEKYTFEKVYNVDVDYSILPDKVENTYWEEDVKEDIKMAFSEEETVYVPYCYRYRKCIEEKKMYKLDQHKECFKTEEEAKRFLINKTEQENISLKRQLADIQQRLINNYEFLGKDTDFDMPKDGDVFLILQKFLDGQIAEVVGYTLDEKSANKKVEELHDKMGVGEFSFYDCTPIDKIKD